jgi:hypothetical protein
MAQCLSFYTYCSNLSVGCYLYTDEKRVTTVSAGWISDGTNVYSVNSSGMITAITACSNCQPSGTFITSYCGGGGYDLYFTYANGSCGTYDSIQEYNSSICGYSSGYSCSCWGYDCDPYPDPCYYYGCSFC